VAGAKIRLVSGAVLFGLRDKSMTKREPRSNSQSILAAHVRAIKDNSKKSVEAHIDNGRRLIECKGIVATEGAETWGDWLTKNLHWTQRTAQLDMRLYRFKRRHGNEPVSLFGNQLRLLYKLSARSTPSKIVDDMIARAKDGEILDLKTVVDAIQKFRQAQEPEPENGEQSGSAGVESTGDGESDGDGENEGDGENGDGKDDDETKRPKPNPVKPLPKSVPEQVDDLVTGGLCAILKARDLVEQKLPADEARAWVDSFNKAKMSTHLKKVEDSDEKTSVRWFQDSAYGR
jgi:hypothetical protein